MIWLNPINPARQYDEQGFITLEDDIQVSFPGDGYVYLRSTENLVDKLVLSEAAWLRFVESAKAGHYTSWVEEVAGRFIEDEATGVK